MADEPEDDVLELGPEDEVQDTQETEQVDPPEQEEEDHEFPTFVNEGDEEPTDTDLVKHLRSELRKTQARAKELEQGVKPPPEIVIGEKPTLESCEWDEAKFENELDAWKDRKRQSEEQANKGNEARVAAERQWEAEKATYAKKRSELPYKDVDDVEAVVAGSLNQMQLASIVQTANDAPKLIYALGKNPARLSALAKVTDPAKFIAAAVRLEMEVKMSKRRPTAEPDVPARGSASMTATSDKHEAKLEAEADRTGDRSKLIKYRSEKKAK